MRKSRFTEVQIMGILRQAEGGLAVAVFATHTNAPGTTLGPGGNDAGSTNMRARPNIQGDLQKRNNVKNAVKQVQTATNAVAA